MRKLVEGVFYYSNPYKADDYGNYNVQLVVNDKTANDLVNMGLKPAQRKVETDQGTFISDVSYEEHPGKVFRFRRKSKSKAGKELGAPLVLNSKCLPMKDLIGNGSKGVIEISIYDWEYNGRKGKSAGLVTVQVNELVKYEQKEYDEPLLKVATPSEVQEQPKKEMAVAEIQDDDVPF